MSREYIPMTDPARDALIAVSFLWALFVGVVYLRLLGRSQGAGIGADDILSVFACVSSIFVRRGLDVSIWLMK